MTQVWQACPVCSGTGLVSRPPGVAGDQATWTSTTTGPYPCRPCDGEGVLPTPKTDPLDDLTDAAKDLWNLAAKFVGKPRS